MLVIRCSVFREFHTEYQTCVDDKNPPIIFTRIFAPINWNLYVPTRTKWDKSFTLTLLTSLDPTLPMPYAADLRETSNTQFDFVNCVAEFARLGYLQHGDYLIVDNWSGHYAAAADLMDALVTMITQLV